MRREDLARFLPPRDRRPWQALELGTATGTFTIALAKAALDLGRIRGMLWTVDRYACDGTGEDRHGIMEYEEAASTLIDWSRNVGGEDSGIGTAIEIIPLRMTFKEAALLFAARIQTFDLVYVDGYAHEGSGGLKELRRWWQFVAPGGVLGVHDACDAWPAQRDAVRAFEVELRGQGAKEFGTTDEFPPEYPSWYAVKPEPRS